MNAAPAADPVTGLAVALGIGLLIGLDRERRKGAGPGRRGAGIRTFALVAVSGGLVGLLGSPIVYAGALLFLALAAAAALLVPPREERDPGLTTEVAMLAAFLLGALAMSRPATSAAIAVVATILLVSREPLHLFARQLISREELRDALILLAAALVILPLTPDRALGPEGVLNPRNIWKLVVLTLAVRAAGHVSVRVLGARLGLPTAGFASGFVSSAVATASMGSLVREQPELMRPAAAAAVVANVSTLVELAILVASASTATLRAVAVPLLAAGAATALYAALLAARATPGPAPAATPGRALDPKGALLFAALLTSVLAVSAIVYRRFGTEALWIASVAAGLADTHAISLSVASLVGAGALAASASAVPILLAVSANALTKAVVAAATGGRRFALLVVPALLVLVAFAWGGYLAAR